MITFESLGIKTAEMMNTWKSSDDPLTLKSLSTLQALNKLGFVTTNSQLGTEEVLDNEGIERYSQRAYLEAVCHKKYKDSLINMSCTTDLVVTIINPNIEDYSELIPTIPLSVSKQVGRPYEIQTHTDASYNWDYVLDCIMPYTPDWDNNIFPPRMSFEDRNRLKKDAIIFSALDPQWGREQYLVSETLKTISNQIEYM